MTDKEFVQHLIKAFAKRKFEATPERMLRLDYLDSFILTSPKSALEISISHHQKDTENLIMDPTIFIGLQVSVPDPTFFNSALYKRTKKEFEPLFQIIRKPFSASKVTSVIEKLMPVINQFKKWERKLKNKEDEIKKSIQQIVDSL